MTHDYERHGTTTLCPPSMSSTAPSSAATCRATGTRSSSGFLNTAEAQVPVRMAIHAVVDNYATDKHPKVQMAGPASPLDVSLHAYLGVLAQRRRRLLRQTHETLPQAWSLPVGCHLLAAINRIVEETNSDPEHIWTTSAAPNASSLLSNGGKKS